MTKFDSKKYEQELKKKDTFSKLMNNNYLSKGCVFSFLSENTEYFMDFK